MNDKTDIPSQLDNMLFIPKVSDDSEAIIDNPFPTIGI
jgi:hypothetical protein